MEGENTLRILFGPQHDGLHVNPAQSGAYEWWYFDAISDDGRFVLVAIYFLGSPMTPYYKAVVDGKSPDPRDWCGVFLSLHEKTSNGYRERAYAYNLYRSGDFSADIPQVHVGNSYLASDGEGVFWKWHLNAREQCLWRGDVRLDATFTATGPPLDLPQMGDTNDAAHSWVCVAPVCRADVRVRLSNGKEVSFSGHGYHDHNFGQLPWSDVNIWYWGRGRILEADNGERYPVYYRVDTPDGKNNAVVTIFDEHGKLVSLSSGDAQDKGLGQFTWRNAYGLSGNSYISLGEQTSSMSLYYLASALCYPNTPDMLLGPILVNGSFYIRLFQYMSMQKWREQVKNFVGEDWGIGEVFRPARLCGPIASRAMWTRIRRRS